LLKKISWDGRQHIPLQKTATEILGLSYKEKRAKLFYNDLGRPMKEKYVTIGVQASGPQLKYWNYPRGWDMLVRYLNHKGYKVMAVDLHEDRSRDGYINKSPDGCVKRHGKSLNETINNIRHSEFFIGLASGLSWLAWTLEKHVVMINGMSEPWHEFQDKCIHVFNTDKNVCTGCYHSDETLRLQGDWGICPEHQNTKRQFECTKTIKPPMIFSAIDNVLSDI
jgi:autotransporter strand-loop-strand O-heptosyltransferase